MACGRAGGSERTSNVSRKYPTGTQGAEGYAPRGRSSSEGRVFGTARARRQAANRVGGEGGSGVHDRAGGWVDRRPLVVRLV